MDQWTLEKFNKQYLLTFIKFFDALNCADFIFSPFFFLDFRFFSLFYFESNLTNPIYHNYSYSNAILKWSNKVKCQQKKTIFTQ